MSTISSNNLEALYSFYDWMHKTGRARIIRLSSDGYDLRSLFDHDTKLPVTDIQKNVSDLISSFYYLSSEERELFFNSEPTLWNSSNPSIYLCYRIFKLWWLTEDIKKNGIESPLQIYQSGRNYLCHPGSDKKFSITYVNPQENIKCFYIWYPELDNAPWHWTVPYEEVNTPEEFIKMFPRIKNPTFRLMQSTVTITPEGWNNHGDIHLDPWTEGTWLSCKKHGKFISDKFKLELPTLSYTDAIHRWGMFENISAFKNIKFVNDTKFLLGNYKFLKVNGYWIPNRFNNFPKSIIDTEWKYSIGTTMSTKNMRSSASEYRRWS